MYMLRTCMYAYAYARVGSVMLTFMCMHVYKSTDLQKSSGVRPSLFRSRVPGVQPLRAAAPKLGGGDGAAAAAAAATSATTSATTCASPPVR